MRAIILAAGFGTRLYPLTKDRPMALLPLGKKTLLDYLIEPLVRLPMVKEITIVSNAWFYLDFYEWRNDAPYTKPIFIEDNGVCSPEEKRGTIHDIKFAIESGRKKDEDYLIFCSDIFFDFPLSHFLLPVLSHPDCGFAGLYDLKTRQESPKYGAVQMNPEHRIIDFEERPAPSGSTLISAGVYYFPGSFRHKFNEYLARHSPAAKTGGFIRRLIRDESVYGVLFEGAWFRIGTVQSYEKAREYLHVFAG